MFLAILAWFWIVTGLLFLINPGFLRRRLQKKSYKIVRRYLFIMLIFFAMLLIAAGAKTEGGLSKFIIIIGVILLIKGFFIIKAKAADRMIDFFMKQPIIAFRIWSGVQLIAGFLILKLRA